MKLSTFAIPALALASTFAVAETIELDPGDGRQYEQHWCGGQRIESIATGFVEGNPTTLVNVAAKCATGTGRQRDSRWYGSCWTVTFDLHGNIIDRRKIASVSGTHCGGGDPNAVYQDNGNAASTVDVYSPLGANYGGMLHRAFLTQP